LSRLALLVFTSVLAAGCGSPRPRPTLGPDDRGPGPLEVESAVSDLDRELDDLEPWGSHLPRSRDFPDLPLVRVAAVEDLGRTEADLDAIRDRLEQALRDHRRLRLVADENAVPEVLRDDAPPRDPEDDPLQPRIEPRAPARAGLLLRAWTDRAGRLQLELRDLVLDERLARARTR
jgi:hypothetical protein